MGILTKKINDYNNMGKEVKDPKVSVNQAKATYNEMTEAVKTEVQKRREARRKVYNKIEVREEPKKEASQDNVDIFNSGTLVEDFEDIGIKQTPTKIKSDDREMELASINGGKPVFQLKVLDHSNLYKVEANNVLNLNPFKISFTETELNQYTFQNPMLGQQNGFNRESF